MDWKLVKLWMCIVLVLLTALGAYLEHRRRKKSASIWREIADHCGLHFFDRGVEKQELEGSYRGYDLHVSTETFRVRSGRSTYTYYVTTIAVNALEPGVREVRIDPREPYAHESGDWKATTRSFAAAFRQNDAQITRWLADDEELRNAMARVQAEGDNLEVRQGKVRRSRPHLFASFGDLLKFINTTIELSSRIDARARLFASAEDAPREGEDALAEVANAGAPGGALW